MDDWWQHSLVPWVLCGRVRCQGDKPKSDIHLAMVPSRRGMQVAMKAGWQDGFPMGSAPRALEMGSCSIPVQ